MSLSRGISRQMRCGFDRPEVLWVWGVMGSKNVHRSWKAKDAQNRVSGDLPVLLNLG